LHEHRHDGGNTRITRGETLAVRGGPGKKKKEGVARNPEQSKRDVFFYMSTLARESREKDKEGKILAGGKSNRRRKRDKQGPASMSAIARLRGREKDIETAQMGEGQTHCKGTLPGGKRWV